MQTLASLRRSLVWLLALVLGTCALTSAFAQNTEAQKFDIKVHLPLGATTLDKVASAISEQIGLTIETASYLREHKLVVQIDNLRAHDALDALATLNEWAWYPTAKPGHYLITRHRPSLPREIAEIPAALALALPKEIRRYTGIGVPLKELTRLIDPVMREQLENDKKWGTYEPFAPGVSFGAKSGSLLNKQHPLLLEALQPNPYDGREIRYAALRHDQQQALLFTFVFEALNRFANFPVSQIMSERALPFERDWRQAEIRLEGKTDLSITSSWVEKNASHASGFGAAIKFDDDLTRLFFGSP